MKNNPQSRSIKSAERTFDILEIVHQHDGATLTEISQEIDLARSTLHDYLKTHVNAGYLVKEGKQYYVSLRLLELGQQAKITRTAWEQVKPVLREIGNETGEHVWFVVEEHGKGVYVDNYAGEHVISLFNTPGVRHHLHCTAAGKSILAHLPEQRVADILESYGLPEFTDQTITNESALRDQLAEIRETGVAFADGEWNEGLRAVACPVIRDDELIGAITLGAPSKRLSGSYYRDEIPSIVSGAVNRLELSFTKR
ncbi:IclR family transcriptional regulator [Halobellus salinisoli]|uniref:IclR family transcriptional regulator n=1 Tax=Halobellus salinisoli TaxID=3108500 RepID=UPI00300A97C7